MSKSVQRGLMERAWQLLPDPRRFLETLAKMPPVWKGPLLERIGGVGLDVAQYRGTDELPTNFAIKGPTVWIPIRAGRVYLFGNPAKRFGEASTIRLCRALLADAGAFVDIGAHVGLYLWSLLPLFGPTRPGYFFEPNPELFSILQANASRLTRYLEGFAVAVDDHDGFTDFYVDMEDWSMSTVVGDPRFEHRYRRTRVQCIRFDSFAREVRLQNAVVKADIEGGEAQLLEGLALSGLAVLDFVCEVLEPAFGRGFVSEAATKLDADAYLISEGRLSPAARITSWHRTDHNWLFTRRPRSVLERVVLPNGFRIA
jgi:FkbM family methyltransferase